MDGMMEEAAESVGGVGDIDDEDVEMKDATSPAENGEPVASSSSNGTAASASDIGDTESNDKSSNDVQLYVNWAEEAAAAREPVSEPLPESVILVMAKVFNNDMLVENILEQVIYDNDRATLRSCRLVSKVWLIALAKLFRKMKKPQFVVNTKRNASLLNEARPRPMFEQHTLLYEFIKPMTTNVRHEGFIPTFSLILGPSYFRKTNYTDFVNCLVQCGSSLVELYIHFPKNSAMSFLLPPDISLPSLTTFGVSFSSQSLLGHHFPVPYHHQHDYFPNNCSIHLVQSVLNASKSLKKFHFLHCNSPMNPPDLENLYLPDSLASVHIETPLREFDLFLRKPFPYLTELRINSTIALYSEETIYELLGKLSSTLRTIWLTGPPATRRSLPIKLPRLEHVTKFYMFKPWEFEEREPVTNFEEVFPNLETLVFANQTQYSFNYLMKGMRSTTVTSFCVCLTSYRPTHPGLMVHIHEDLELVGRPLRYPGALAGPVPLRDERENERIRREMRVRLDRFREMAGRGARGLLQRRDGDNNNPVLGQAAAAAAAAAYEVRLRDMQQRNQVRMQQHMNRFRELRERYHRYAPHVYNNPYQVDRLPRFELRINPDGRNRNNDLNNVGNNDQQRPPALEIRRVVPGRNNANGGAGPALNPRNADGGERPVPLPRRRINRDGAPEPPPRAVNECRAYLLIDRAGFEDIMNQRPRPRPRPAQNNNNFQEIAAGNNDDDVQVVADNPPPPLPIEHRNPHQGERAGPSAAINIIHPPVENLRGNNRGGAAAGARLDPPVRRRSANDLDADIRENIDILDFIGPAPEPLNVNPIREGLDAVANPNDDHDIQIVREIPVPRYQVFLNERLVGRHGLNDQMEASDSDSDIEPLFEIDRAFARVRRSLRLHDGRPVVPEGVVAGENNNNNGNDRGNNEDRAAPQQEQRDNVPLPPAADNGGEANNQNNNGGAGAGVNDNQNNEDPVVVARRNRDRRALRRAFAGPRRAWPGANGNGNQGPAGGGAAGGGGWRPERHMEFYDFRNPIAPPLPDRPVTMTRDRMQSINLAFPNLVKLTIQVSGPETCGLRYIFAEMKSLQVLKIIVESSLWKIKWDPLLVGIPEDFCDAVKANSEIWDDVYLTENTESIRNLTKLEELMLVESLKVDDREPQHQALDDRQISDVSFHFGFFKLKSIKQLTVTPGFSPSQAMYNRWYEEKGFKIKVKPKKRLDLNYYADQ